MWILLGVGAGVFAVLSLIFVYYKKDAKWFSYISLSLTALTICQFYADATSYVISQEWAALMDIMPTLRTILWIGTIASILINAFSLSQNK